jgi:hypothetical protein
MLSLMCQDRLCVMSADCASLEPAINVFLAKGPAMCG